MNPRPGKVARVRTRQYLIEEVIPPPNRGDQTLVRLSCLDDDAQGQRLEVLWEKEVDAEVLGETSWERVAAKGFDEPRIFSSSEAGSWAPLQAPAPRFLDVVQERGEPLFPVSSRCSATRPKPSLPRCANASRGSAWICIPTRRVSSASAAPQDRTADPSRPPSISSASPTRVARRGRVTSQSCGRRCGNGGRPSSARSKPSCADACTLPSRSWAPTWPPSCVLTPPTTACP